MKYFILLNLFPCEIVNIIYNFIIKDLSEKKIRRSIINYITKKDILYKSIDYLLCTNHFICLEYISYFGFIMNTNYNNSLYKNYFWHHYLNIFSIKLMGLYNNIYIINNSNNFKIIKKQYKMLVKIWYKLCKKFDMYLKIGIYKNNNISKRDYYFINSIRAKDFKIKNFSKFATCPQILLHLNYPIDQSLSIDVISLMNDVNMGLVC
jgi:hypothetical protein